MAIQTVRVDLHDPIHAEALLRLLDAYARDPMGGGVGLAHETQRELIGALQSRHDYVGLLALHKGEPVGLLNAFEGFSTFAAKPLLNIHDVYVDTTLRGHGIGQALLLHAEQIARERGCCKLTLEVLAGNTGAQRVYQAQGYQAYTLNEATGQALFWQKGL